MLGDVLDAERLRALLERRDRLLATPFDGSAARAQARVAPLMQPITAGASASR
jgi:hypothetical protein